MTNVNYMNKYLALVETIKAECIENFDSLHTLISSFPISIFELSNKVDAYLESNTDSERYEQIARVLNTFDEQRRIFNQHAATFNEKVKGIEPIPQDPKVLYCYHDGEGSYLSFGKEEMKIPKVGFTGINALRPGSDPDKIISLYEERNELNHAFKELIVYFYRDFPNKTGFNELSGYRVVDYIVQCSNLLGRFSEYVDECNQLSDC